MKFRDGPHVGRIYFSPVTLLFPPRRPDGRRSVPSSQKIPLSVKWAALQESFFFSLPRCPYGQMDRTDARLRHLQEHSLAFGRMC